MFTLAEDTKIGAELKRLILSQYKTVRAFIQVCLAKSGESITKEEVQRKANRMTQICKGNKRVQLSDLPLFADILGVSPEYILSAGEDEGPKKEPLTNASVARSSDPVVWKKFLEMHTERDVDEYGKTLVAYALEFRNHALIHYLVEVGEIRFWGHPEPGRKFGTFGAVMDCWGISEEQQGFTQISPRIIKDSVPLRLVDDPELLEGMMRLAIEANDVELLREMHARETQEQRYMCSGWDLVETGKINRSLVNAISAAGEEVIAYFAGEYTIRDNFGKQERWLSPLFEPLLQSLLEKDHPLAEQMLKTAEAHNQYAGDHLARLFAGDQKNFTEDMFGYEEGQKIIREELLRSRRFSKAGSLVIYIDARSRDRLSTNLIRVDEKLAPEALRSQAERVNRMYRRVCELQPVVAAVQGV